MFTYYCPPNELETVVLMNGVNWEIIFAIKSSLVCGFGAGCRAGFGAGTTGFGSGRGAFRIATKFGSEVLVS